jgi:cell division protease FtsH
VWIPWALSAVLFLAVGSRVLRGEDRGADTFAYSELIDRVSSGQVRSLTVTNGTGRTDGTLVDGTDFQTTTPWPLPDGELSLLRSRAEFTSKEAPGLVSGTSRWVLLFATLAFAGFLLRAFSRLANVDRSGSPATGRGGKQRAWWSTERPRTTFASVAGHTAAKGEVAEVVSFLRNPTIFRDIGANAPRGILLVGPPGTGKTLMARALAGEAGVPFLSVSGSDFMELFVGVGASRVRELFATARRLSPCIVFIDEIDAVGRHRGSGAGSDERDQTLNQLLSEMDGFDSRDEVIVLAATNRVDVLDPALLRPGRFDRQVVMPLPEVSERVAILRSHLAQRRVAADISVDELARATPGMSGADLANLVNEAALHAIRRSDDVVQQGDLDVARDRMTLGLARHAVVLTPEERLTIAVHESGHALVATVLDGCDPVDRVTILPRGQSLGATLQQPEVDRHALRREELLDRICLALAGRAAELVVLGTQTTGAADDLRQATSLARKMVVEWGMSDVVGPRSWDGTDPSSSGEIRAEVDTEIGVVLRSQDVRCRQLLHEHRRALDHLTEELLTDETIDGETVRSLVHRTVTGP